MGVQLCASVQGRTLKRLHAWYGALLAFLKFFISLNKGLLVAFCAEPANYILAPCPLLRGGKQMSIYILGIM